MDKQADILAALLRIEVLLAKRASMSAVQIELIGHLVRALPGVDSAKVSQGIAKAMRQIESIGHQ